MRLNLKIAYGGIRVGEGEGGGLAGGRGKRGNGVRSVLSSRFPSKNAI